MGRARRIGILTGGGDVPGLNSVIKSVTYRATEQGYEVLGIRRGWEGLTHGRVRGDGNARPRVHPAPRPDQHPDDRPDRRHGPPHVADQSAQDGRRPPAGLAVRGAARPRSGSTRRPTTSRRSSSSTSRSSGSTSSSRSAATTRCPSRASWPTAACPLIAIPKTMDNDVQGTEYCIGFSSAITRAKELIDRQRTTLGSHERIGVFRIFGRDAGFSALFTAYVTSGRCVIPEAPYDLDALAGVLAADHADNPSHYAFVITAEGAIWQGAKMVDVGEADAFGHRHKANIGEALAIELKARTGIETVASELTYDLRSRPAGHARPARRDDVRQRRDGPPGRRASPGGWSRSATASTPTRRCPIRPSARARSTSRRSTTWSASGRSTRPGSASRCSSRPRSWRSSAADAGTARPGSSVAGRTGRGSRGPGSTCPRRRSPAATRPFSSCAARPASGRTAPSSRARFRAIPRSLRWSRVLKPSGYSLAIIRALRLARIQLPATPPPRAATTWSGSRPAFIARTSPSATAR